MIRQELDEAEHLAEEINNRNNSSCVTICKNVDKTSMSWSSVGGMQINNQLAIKISDSATKRNQKSTEFNNYQEVVNKTSTRNKFTNAQWPSFLATYRRTTDECQRCGYN
jgi:hypothetical protein